MSFSSDNPQLINQLPLSIDFPKDPEQLQMIQSTAYKKTVDAMNSKEGGLYLLQEIGSYIQYFPTSVDSNSSQSLILRPGYRRTYDIVALNGGSISSGSTVSVPHNLDMSTVTAITRMYGGAITNGPFFIPIPYASPTPANCIELFADSTNITIVVGSGQNKITQLYVVLEYLRNP